MKSKGSKKRRDELRAMLSQEMASAKAPGNDVARNAIGEKASKPKVGQTAEKRGEATEPARIEKRKEQESNARSTGKQPAKANFGPHAIKLSISIRSEHLDRLDEIKEQIRRLGHRSASDSLAVKIALAGFDAKSPDLGRLLQQAKEQDGRAKS